MTQLQITRSAVRKPQGRRRKSCPFSGPNAPKIDYKDVKLLTRFTSERGKSFHLAFLSRQRNNVNYQPLSSVRVIWRLCPT